jgi:AraC-like DNA-binding protein
MKIISYSEQENVAISEVVMNIFRENKRKNILYQRIIDLNIQQLLALIERDQSPDNKKGRSSSIDTAGAYIDEYCLTTINLKELASNIGYCTDRFRNLFKSHFGVTPKQYILDKKLKESKRMLVESKYTLEQISTMVGFNYYSRFSLFFKEKTGFSPKEYRLMNEKK